MKDNKTLLVLGTAALALRGLLQTLVDRGGRSTDFTDFAHHRQWMIRAFAAALAVSTVRVIGVVVQMIDRTTPAQTVTISFWLGWTLTLAAAETYIRATSTSARMYSSAAHDTGSAIR